MLKTFPKRKNMFCHRLSQDSRPRTLSVCSCSQRRRWINSTVHNLPSFYSVRDLCGTFCSRCSSSSEWSWLEHLFYPLLSLLLLPYHHFHYPWRCNTTIPLVLLAIVLGLPGLLIVITSRKIAYVGWMLVTFFLCQYGMDFYQLTPFGISMTSPGVKLAKSKAVKAMPPVTRRESLILLIL